MKQLNQKKKFKFTHTIGLTLVIAALILTGGTLAGINELMASPSSKTRMVSGMKPLPGPNLPVKIADVVERVSPAVVSITVTKRLQGVNFKANGLNPLKDFFERFFNDETEKQFRRHNRQSQAGPKNSLPHVQGMGSGFVIDKEGLIVTNNHVIDGAHNIQVKLHTGRKVNATLVGRDQKTDLALLKVDVGEDLPAVAFGDSANMRVGDWVLTLGNPFGIGKTATTGIISARHRNIGAGPFDDFLQIDAPINKGNSGGPTFNMNGEVIGVNTAIFSPSGGNVGIGFAIPSNMTRDIIKDLREDGYVTRGWLGVHIQEITPEIAESLDLGTVQGALVSRVIESSPAAKSGIRRGDVILNVDGKEVQALRDLTKIIADIDAGDTAHLSVWRGGKRENILVHIGSASNTEQMASLREDVVQGMKLSKLDDRLRRSFGFPNTFKGVMVSNITAGTSAAEMGLRKGDIIVSIGDVAVEKPKDIAQIIDNAKSINKRVVLLLIVRDAEERFVALPIKNT